VSTATLSLSTHRDHGVATMLAGTISPEQQGEITTGMQFAQVRTDERVDWLNDPREWLGWFMRVESGLAGWQDWRIEAVPVAPRRPAEPVLDWTVRSLRQAGPEGLDPAALDKAVTALRELIRAGDPVAAPFGSAERNRSAAGYSFGYVYPADDGCLLRTSFICVNFSKQVKDFVLWEDKRTRLGVQAMTLRARWNRSNYKLFEPKIGEYLAKKTEDLMRENIAFN
jgi:hypothetical protein